jgi:hypothetical protein
MSELYPIEQSVLDTLLDEEEGYMCRDAYWPASILKKLVDEGKATCEVRVGIPTYWRIPSEKSDEVSA